MTVKQAAEKLEVSPSMVYALIDEGRLPHERIGRRGKRGKIIIRDEHLEAFRAEVRAVLEDD